MSFGFYTANNSGGGYNRNRGNYNNRGGGGGGSSSFSGGGFDIDAAQRFARELAANGGIEPPAHVQQQPPPIVAPERREFFSNINKLPLTNIAAMAALENDAAQARDSTFDASRRSREKREKDKAAKKKQEEKEAATRKANSGIGDIGTFFAKSRWETRDKLSGRIYEPQRRAPAPVTEFVVPTSRPTPVDGSGVSDSRYRQPPPPPPREVLMPPEFPAHEIGFLSSAEERLWKRLQQPFAPGCCNDVLCMFEPHAHAADTSVLGLERQRERERRRLKPSAEPYNCLRPVDPFVASEFSLFKYIATPLAKRRDDGWIRRIDPMRLHNGMAQNDLISQIVYLRRFYHTQLANIRATADRAQQEIQERYVQRRAEYALALNTEHVGNQHDRSAAELDRAQHEDLIAERQLFDEALSALDLRFDTLLAQALNNANGYRFALSFPLTHKAAGDIVRLRGGEHHDDQFYVELVKELIVGDLDNLEIEKQRMSSDLPVDERDLFTQAFLKRASVTVWRPHEDGGGDALLDQSAFKVAQAIVRKDASDKAAQQSTQSTASQAHSRVDDNDDGMHPTPPHSPPPPPTQQPPPPIVVIDNDSAVDRIAGAKRRRSDSGGGGEDERLSVRPCRSQNDNACSAIAFLAAKRFATLYLYPTLGVMTVDEILRTFVEFEQIVARGEEIYSEYRRRLVAVPAAERVGRDFMRPADVTMCDDKMGAALAADCIVVHELSGQLFSRSSVLGDDDPVLEQALRRARRFSNEANAEGGGSFGAVFTFREYSYAVGMVQGRWILFDSHDVDHTRQASLCTFDDLGELCVHLRTLLERFRPDPSLGEGNEMQRMTRGSYELYVLIKKLQPPPPAPVDSVA